MLIGQFLDLTTLLCGSIPLGEMQKNNLTLKI